MSAVERGDAELDALLDATSAELAKEGRPQAGDDALVARAIEGALLRATQRPVRPLRSERWRRATLLAAATLIATSSALALVERARSVAHDRQTKSAPPQERSTILAASSEGVRAIAEAQPAPAETCIAAPPAHDPIAAPAGDQAALASPIERSVPSAAKRDAAALFSRANESRRNGDDPEAAAEYGLLQRRFPRSPEAALSRVTLGRLSLDRLHDPGRALVQFDAYLGVADNVALREEAMVGRALALQELGREDEERGAWQALLVAYPRSLSSDRAKERLRELR